MPDQLKLRNPPIVEAVIGIEFDGVQSVSMEDVNLAKERLAADYPNIQPLWRRQFSLLSHGEMQSNPSLEDHGLRLLSDDGVAQLQLRRDGFLYSRLGAYDSWETFKNGALKAWSAFRECAASARMSSYGVRYVNKLTFPLSDGLETYLTLFPSIPNSFIGEPQVISNGHLRLEIPLEKESGRLIVQEIIMPPERDGYATIALDNDFRCSALGLQDKEVWAGLDQLRSLKNRYFLHFITDKLLEMYK
jgi:uncharacterized protein (TIGR04255 family)